MATTKKKSAKQKRILIASILIAAAITVGGTFAWFISSDSVTNRLSASADYGVSITEDFTPPENWTPGQTIDKNVGAVNTGNVSAFVKLSLTNAMTVTYETTSDTVTASANITVPQETTSENLTTKPVFLSGDGTDKAETNDTPDEVLAAKAGGVLVYTTSLTEADTDAVQTVDSAHGNGTEFTPTSTGLYIFRRSVKNDFSTTENYEYDGFYYDGTSKYYKITDINPTVSTGTATKGQVTGCTFKFVTETTNNAVVPTLTYEDAVTSGNDQHPARVVATYSRTNNSDDDIVIYINLADGTVGNSGNYAHDSVNSNETHQDFYLNSILAPGTTAADLVESVELSQDTKDGAYLDFTYDLNIDLSSVQAVYATDGTIDATKSKTAGDTLSSGATVTVSEVDDQTATVSWEFTYASTQETSTETATQTSTESATE